MERNGLPFKIICQLIKRFKPLQKPCVGFDIDEKGGCYLGYEECEPPLVENPGALDLDKLDFWSRRDELFRRQKHLQFLYYPMSGCRAPSNENRFVE